MAYEYKPIEAMDKEHLINSVNKLSMPIDRRRDCLVELRERFDRDYTYVADHCKIHRHKPSQRVYDGRFFEDDWYTSGKDKFYYVSANYDKPFISEYTNIHYKLKPGDTVVLKCLDNKHDIYTDNQMTAMGTIVTIDLVTEYYFYIKRVNAKWSYADIERVITKQTSKTKGQTMKTTLTKQLDNNKQAAVLAAELTAGKVLNTKVVSLIKPKLPMMLRGYADSPIAAIAIANITGMALKQYFPDNTKANKVADLMLNSAALQLMESFNIEALLDELLDGVKLPELKGNTNE